MLNNLMVTYVRLHVSPVTSRRTRELWYDPATNNAIFPVNIRVIGHIPAWLTESFKRVDECKGWKAPLTATYDGGRDLIELRYLVKTCERIFNCID